MQKNVKNKSFHAQLDFPRIPDRYSDELWELLLIMMAEEAGDRP